MIPSRKGVCVPPFPLTCPGVTSLLPVFSSERFMFPLGCVTYLLVPCRCAEHLKCCLTSLCGQPQIFAEFRLDLDLLETQISIEILKIRCPDLYLKLISKFKANRIPIVDFKF